MILPLPKNGIILNMIDLRVTARLGPQVEYGYYKLILCPCQKNRFSKCYSTYNFFSDQPLRPFDSPRNFLVRMSKVKKKTRTKRLNLSIVIIGLLE